MSQVISATKVESWNGSMPDGGEVPSRIAPIDIGLPTTGWSKGPDGMYTRWCDITPAMAAKWLEKNVNRRLNKSASYFYGDQMNNGQWHPTHQGIAFDTKGFVRDGQHRLNGIVESGCMQTMLVTINLSEEAVMVVDIQNKRSDADALTIMGLEDVNNRTVAIIKRMVMGGADKHSVKISRDDLIKLCLEWKEPILFTKPMWSYYKLGNAAISAVICRAWFTQDREKLERFMEVMRTGVSRCEEEDTIVRLRDWYRGIGKTASGGSSTRAEIYRKIEFGLRYYLEGKKLIRVCEQDEECFHIPQQCTPSAIGVHVTMS